MDKKEKQKDQSAAVKDQNPNEEVQETLDSAEQSAEDAGKKITELTEETERLRDQLLRARSEFENFRRRRNREAEELKSWANAGLIEDLLPVLDDLKLLINNSDKTTDASSLLDGAKLIQQKFSEILKRRGLEEVKAEGETFDPDLHEALMQVPSEDAEPGTVLDVHQSGYKLGSKLLRPSRVIVAANPDKE